MSDEAKPAHITVLSRSWRDGDRQLAFVTRAVAGAASRQGHVDVLVPGTAGAPVADGAFDLHPVGTRAGGWPETRRAQLDAAPAPDVVIVEGNDAGALRLYGQFAPGVPLIVIDTGTLSGSSGKGVVRGARTRGASGSATVLTVIPGRRELLAARPGAPGVEEVGLLVEVNPIAAARRNNALGFTDYLLILTDRPPGVTDNRRPTALAAWIAARFPREHVVVVENAVASVWRSRALMGEVAVDTRTDLWRLMAHARVTIDLAPGSVLPRECIESLRFGTPIIVPAGTGGAELAACGGGLWFRDEAELLGCIEILGDPVIRDALSRQGRTSADARYGDADRFVERVSHVLTVAMETAA